MIRQLNDLKRNITKDEAVSATVHIKICIKIIDIHGLNKFAFDYDKTLFLNIFQASI